MDLKPIYNHIKCGDVKYYRESRYRLSTERAYDKPPNVSPLFFLLSSLRVTSSSLLIGLSSQVSQLPPLRILGRYISSMSSSIAIGDLEEAD
jgi:hypothetical protein